MRHAGAFKGRQTFGCGAFGAPIRVPVEELGLIDVPPYVVVAATRRQSNLDERSWQPVRLSHFEEDERARVTVDRVQRFLASRLKKLQCIPQISGRDLQ